MFDTTNISPMKGEAMVIHMNRDVDNYRPLKIQTARPVPLHFQAAAKITLDELIKGGGGA